MIGDTGPTQARYSKPAGKGFIIAETCDNAVGRSRRLKKRRTRWSHTKIVTNCNTRMKDLERVITGCCGGPCETDDAEMLFELALPLLVARHIAYGRPEEDLDTMVWAKKFTPHLLAQQSVEWFRDAERRILAEFDNHDGEPSIGKIDDMSRALRITEDMRAEYGLKHLTAIERPPEVRKREAKRKNAAHNKAKRERNGSTPREASITAREPWKAHGIGRSKYYEMIAQGKIPADVGMRPVVAVETDDGLNFSIIPGEKRTA